MDNIKTPVKSPQKRNITLIQWILIFLLASIIFGAVQIIDYLFTGKFTCWTLLFNPFLLWLYCLGYWWRYSKNGVLPPR